MGSDELKALATIVRHRDVVRLNLLRLSHELERRSLAHDLSKLAPDEIEGFARINRTAREHAYGSPEYEAAMAREKQPGGCIALHFSRNSHHPEYHEADAEMGFLDVIEMVLDWKAAADTYGVTTLRDSMPLNRGRFAFTPAQWWLIGQVVDWIDPPAARAAREEREGG